MVALAVPVLRQDRASLALLNVVEIQQFSHFLESQPLEPGARLRLVDSTGGTIAMRGEETMDASRATFQRTAASSVAPWRVEITMPHTDFAAPLWRAGSALAALLIAAALVGILGGTWAGHHLARELQLLTAGSLENADASRVTEIAAIGQRLQEMTTEREAAEAARREAELKARQEIEQASLALQVREAQLRGIFDSASDAIITVNDSQTVLMANPAAAAMFAVAPGSLIGSNLSSLVPERFRITHAEHIRAFGETGVSARHMGHGEHLSALRANGEEFPIDAAISRAHVDGQRLFTVILRDVSERQRVARELQANRTELQASHAALQRLVVAQDRIQENERRRIARELHDDLQQTLAAIVIEAAALRGELSALGDETTLDRIDGLAASAIDSTRRIVHDLRPQTLEELGLVPALKALAAGFARQTGIACQVEVAEALKRRASPPDDIATCLYRVVQEALNNVAKHSEARQVKIGLLESEGKGLTLRVDDDGRGIRPDERTKPESLGLVGMRERVLAIGGSLEVSSEPGKGTRLQVNVPG
jgi:two-component system sensor kinase